MILKRGSWGKEVATLQSLLGVSVDGFFGPVTEKAVMEYQRAHNIFPIDGIVGPKTMAMMAVIDIKKTNKRTIKEIICHCTATKEGQMVTVADVDKWHRAQGWPNGIGYHYLIYLDGSVHVGRDVDMIGSHCKNHNSHSIGVCYVGGLDLNGKPKDTRTESQKKAFEVLLKKLKQLYPNASIHGHNEFSAKACPCFDVRKEYSKI